MVFPYMDHDLAGLLENERVKLQPSQIKLYMKQLLEGTEYMHRVSYLLLLCIFPLFMYQIKNNILHRDMKAANLLISNTGNLKIADFGLARSFDHYSSLSVPDNNGHSNTERNGGGGIQLDWKGKERKFTNCVVTRWYRPPELLMGARMYGGEVDIWGIGYVVPTISTSGFLRTMLLEDVF